MANATRHLIAQALEDLLRQKTLDKITVKEIVEKSGVNRQTFYYNCELAEMVQVDPSMICQIERGSKIPTLALGRQLADVLHCSLDELAGRMSASEAETVGAKVQ